MSNQAELIELAEKMKESKVLVIGDVTLDRFTIGKATKISPEAPVPIVEVESEFFSPGAAANVIRNINALGADVLITTVVGDDLEGDYLIDEIKKLGISPHGIFKDKNRVTTLVHRIRADAQQILRIDKCKDEEIVRDLAKKIVGYVKRLATESDIFLVADYGRGVITSELVGELVKIAKNKDKKIVVNPKKEHFSYYEEVDVIRTNRNEASFATGVAPINETSMRIMGQKILNSLKCNAVLITWIEGGFHLFEGEKVTLIPSLLKHPIDLTGVGDTISCALALGLAAGGTLTNSAKLANYAGAITARKKGLAVATPEELLETIKKGFPT
jgi:D-beta-D-heptose 7-phosphate kinase/D-beta-D-heptose 1-phosphate adenosyltransferase